MMLGNVAAPPAARRGRVSSDLTGNRVHRACYCVENGAKRVAESRHGGDDGNADQDGDKRILDRGRARLVCCDVTLAAMSPVYPY
jgi:hypothetical protein